MKYIRRCGECGAELIEKTNEFKCPFSHCAISYPKKDLEKAEKYFGNFPKWSGEYVFENRKSVVYEIKEKKGAQK